MDVRPCPSSVAQAVESRLPDWILYWDTSRPGRSAVSFVRDGSCRPWTFGRVLRPWRQLSNLGVCRYMHILQMPDWILYWDDSRPGRSAVSFVRGGSSRN